MSLRTVDRTDVLSDRLSGLLEGETELLESLLKTLQKERAAVVESDINTLNRATKEKENLILKIRILEEQRQHLMLRISRALNLGRSPLTLTQLINKLGAPHSIRLNQICSSIIALTQSIEELNTLNRGLLMHSLDLVRSSLLLFDQSAVSPPVYYRTGKVQTDAQTGKIVSGII